MRIKKFNQFNEEISQKAIRNTLVAGISGLMVAYGVNLFTKRINGVDRGSTSTYTGKCIVRSIENREMNNAIDKELSLHPRTEFEVEGKDKKGNTIIFKTKKMTFNVGDTIYVDFTKNKAYPIKDSTNNTDID